MGKTPASSRSTIILLGTMVPYLMMMMMMGEFEVLVLADTNTDQTLAKRPLDG